MGADCGSDHELLIAKFRLKLKKVRKSTRPFRYDLNQILCDYTLEVRNRFKGLDLIDRVPGELQMEVHDIMQEADIKTIPMWSPLSLLQVKPSALSLSTSPHVLPSGVGLVPSPGLSALDWCVSCLCSTPQQLEFSPPPL